MEDDTTSDSESDSGTFEVEFTASQLKALHSLLSYNAINMDNPEWAEAARGLAQFVHAPMISEEFDTAMQEEYDEIMENIDQNPQNMMGGGMPSNRVGFQ